MPGEDYQSWSTVAANNGTVDPLIDWHEGQARASVNNSARSEMAAHAKDRNLRNGSIVTTGTANAQAFLSGVTYTTVPTGLVVKLKIGAGLTNTGSATLNMDGIGDTLITTGNSTALQGHELIGGAYADFLYDGTSWVFLYSQQFIDYQLHGGGGIIIGKQIFDVAGTHSYLPTPGMECCIIECIGGGSGGVGVFGTVDVTTIGGGGGSGGYSRKYASAGDIGGSQVVTVGAGGVGGAPFSDHAIGLAGEASSVGTLCVANGGQSQDAWWVGGAGGDPGTGDIVAAGAPGEAGGQTAIVPGEITGGGGGGSGPFGGGGKPPSWAITQLATNPGRAYGSGGASSLLYNVGGATPGGDGSSGVVIITEFAGRGAPGRDGTNGINGAPGPAGPAGPAGPSGSGTGDVLRFGTPVTDQVAQWTDASHITGVPIATLLANATLTGIPTTPTAAPGTNTTQIASTAFTTAAVAAAVGPFPAGTAMLFVQAAAPTGWTKSTTQNNKALRIVSGGTGGSAGGSVAFSTLFGRTATDSHTLTVAEMPAHTHAGVNGGPAICGTAQFLFDPGASYGFDTYGLANTGGDGGHIHPIDMRLQYVDVIICTKN